MTSLVPLYLKHVFADEPYFDKAKIVYHFDEGFEAHSTQAWPQKPKHGIPAEALGSIAEPTFDNLNALGMEGADTIIVGLKTSPLQVRRCWLVGQAYLPYSGSEGFVAEINAFYDEMLEGKTEAVAGKEVLVELRALMKRSDLRIHPTVCFAFGCLLALLTRCTKPETDIGLGLQPASELLDAVTVDTVTVRW